MGSIYHSFQERDLSSLNSYLWSQKTEKCHLKVFLDSEHLRYVEMNVNSAAVATTTSDPCYAARGCYIHLFPTQRSVFWVVAEAH